MALAVALPLAAIIAPYRHVYLPSMFILGVALLGGVWCLKTAVQNVEKLLFVFLLYIPFQKVLPGDFGGVAKALNFTNVLLILLLVGWLMRPSVEDDSSSRNRWTAQGVAIFAFLIVMSVSIAAEAVQQSGDMRYELLADLKRWLTPFLVYLFVTSFGRSTTIVKRMCIAIVVTTAVIGLLGVKQFWMDMGGGTRHNLEGIRIEVTSGPSNLGALFAYYVPYIFALWVANFWNVRYWALLFPITWCLDALRTTFSRGALLAFVVGALVVILKRSKLAFAALAFVAACLFLQSDATQLPYSIFGRMSNTYNVNRPGDTVSEKLDTSSRTRLVIWAGALEMMNEHPLFGVGYGRFHEEIGAYRPEVADMDPHNNFLKIGAETGIPALALFVVLLAVCFWRGWRCYGKLDDPFLKAIVLGYCGSVIALAVANLFGSRLDSDEITTQFWAMTGGIVLIERSIRRSAAGEDAEVAADVDA
jgi:putative inorganic carbon (hco3(-)) transporter